MTDLQPSPPGYRGQDEAPGPARSPSSTFPYARSHSVAADAQPFKNQTSYPADSYVNQTSSPRGQQADYYHVHKPDGNRVDVNGKKNSHSTYADGYKKNAPGYKNDSGYSESLGFGSYSLPLSERDEASPPPTPPVRDASSLKGVCYGPGHEKYPSWPSAPEHNHAEDDVHGSSAHGGSHRSKSWTDHTSYPKEKPAQYTRPHAKRPNPAFTQQLKTVMERCEKIPAETYEARNRSGNETAESRSWPRVDREGKSLGDAEYVAPSPPEREQQSSQTLSHADLEAYVRSYQDPQVSEMDLYQESSLTQAGLEEYARVQHSQQASYAQSEGYHSYVSSVDSTTNTPFLDRLRRDSEAVAQRPTSSWDDSREGRDSVVTTSSGSASSSETLKWHGSMSDVSVTSGLPARQAGPDKWHHGSMSDVSTSSGMPQKQTSSRDKWQGSLSDVSTSEMSPARNRHQVDKWQSSMNERNKRDRASLPPSMSRNSTVEQSRVTRRDAEWQESSIDEDSAERQPSEKWESTVVSEVDKYGSLSQPMPQSPTHLRINHLASPQSPENWNARHGSMSDLSPNGVQSSKQLIAHSARVQTPQRHHSESVLYLDRERSQRKMYPGNAQPPDMNQQRMPATSPQQAQLSVAERISELEKQQQQQTRYTYLDPDKRHRVSDPTLKAIQKKALLSFYERHHQASWRSEPQLTQGAIPAPQSPPPQPPPRPRPASSRRASSASDYASGTWREKSSRGSNVADLSSPKHQHSNSCGSLSTDLLGPVIVGPAISIDDWVPERPPKKPHLRNVYNDRVPSPDLPPPSPPTVTEHEVLNCDDPLPPPPPDIGEQYPESSENTEEKRREARDPERHRSQPERQSTRRSKHAQKREHDKQQQRKPSPVEATPPPQGHVQRFVRASPLKHADSEMIVENGVSAGFATHRTAATGRSSLRYPATQKLLMNGRSGQVRRVSEERLFPPRAPAQLPDLISQRYSDSGNQRPAPQVPVEPRIIRQESMRVESTRVDASGLLRNDSHRLETSSGQRPQPQVAKNETKPTRPNFLPLNDVGNPSKYPENSHNFTIGSPIKTSYEASSKLFAEGSPQKYHEPPKYVPNSQRHVENGQSRNYYALPPKYVDVPVQIPQPQIPMDRYSAGSPTSPPPPLAPRQNTPGRKSLPPPPRPAPPRAQQGSQSKASYLAYRRERGAPDSEGSYKRTMSPTARLDDWPPLRDRDDPVLLRVTPRHPHPLHHPESLPKSHSVDALHHRLEERTAHSVEVIGKLSYDLSKKLQASEVRSSRGENNNNVDANHHHDGVEERKERISPQSIQVLNDRNRQLERERRKLAASCEPASSVAPHRRAAHDVISAPEDFERSATIEMTSRNVELLNRRNAVHEKRSAESPGGEIRPHQDVALDTRPPPIIEKPPPPTTSPPRTPELDRRQRTATLNGPSGAVPRRTGSSSGPSSPKFAEVRTSSLPSRSSPKSDNDEASSSVTSRRKVSSPSQTDDTGAAERRRRTSSPDQASSNFTRASQTHATSEHSPSSIPASPTSPTPNIAPGSPTTSSPVQTNDRSTVTTSPCVSPQPGIEGLTLVQRTEIVLRVNAATSDAASQTEILVDDPVERKCNYVEITPEPRKKLPEEIECEELSRDLASQLSPNDKLLPILVPAPEHKKPTDYVTGLFRVEATLQPQPKRTILLEETPESPTSTMGRFDDAKIETLSSIPSTPGTPTDPSSPLSPSSAYFTTSEGKARFLTRYSRDVTEETTTPSSIGSDGAIVATPITPTNNQDLKQKKEELVLRLDRKLVVLRAEQEAVREEGENNDALGARVTSRVTAIARTAEASKYRLHVEEVGKITSLLLGLSGRLARAENALHGMPADHAERKILESKRDKLLDQLEEAKVLKSNIDKRSVNVSAILSKYLNEEEYADYQHFINMKAKLIMDGREIQDKVKLGEEQLAALKEAID